MKDNISKKSEDEDTGRRLDELVLGYITEHRKGVRLSAMEKKFHESRMRISFITRKLINEGKILRIHDDFFPTGDH